MQSATDMNQNYRVKTEQLHELVKSLAVRLQIQLEQTNRKNHDVECANEELKKENDELKRQNQLLNRDLEEQSIDCATRLKQQQGRYQQLNQQLFAKSAAMQKSKRAMIQQHEMEMNKMRKEYDEEITYLRATMERIQQDLDTIREERAMLKKKCSDLFHENQFISSELSEVRATLQEHLVESASREMAANRKIQRLTNDQSGMLRTISDLQIIRERFVNLRNAIDAVLDRSRKYQDEKHPGDDGMDLPGKDQMQKRLLDIQLLPKRIVDLHKSRYFLKTKLKKINDNWRDRVEQLWTEIDALDLKNRSMESDLKVYGWTDTATVVSGDKKATNKQNVAAELQCSDLQRHIDALRTNIALKDSQIINLRENVRSLQMAAMEQRRLHCSGVLMLSNRLISMEREPHHSHYEWKAPSRNLDVKMIANQGYDEMLKEMEGEQKKDDHGSPVGLDVEAQVSPMILNAEGNSFNRKIEIAAAGNELPIDVVESV